MLKSSNSASNAPLKCAECVDPSGSSCSLVEDQPLRSVEVLEELGQRRTRSRNRRLRRRRIGRSCGKGQGGRAANDQPSRHHHRSASWWMFWISHAPFLRSSVMVILVAVLRVRRSVVVTMYSRRLVTVAVSFEITGVMEFNA